MEFAHLQPQNLVMQLVGGLLGQLDGADDARVQQQAAVLNANAGYPRQVGESNPFADVMFVQFQFGGHCTLSIAINRLSQECSGVVDAQGLQAHQVSVAEARQLR
jgi:hypothetical protein